MIDGLMFVWVEKEIISPVIKYFESQGLIYVENVCWVMLDQSKKECKYLLLFHFSLLSICSYDDEFFNTICLTFNKNSY